MDKKKKELIEYAKGVRGTDWQPLGIPKPKVHQIKTKPSRSKIKSESRRLINEDDN